MAKKVIMIAPFDTLSGNVSGKQKLKYAKNDNSAYEAPVGKVNYARNYKPRYITAMRSSDGRAYFSVRTRNGVNLSSRAKRSMAVYGGTFALIGSLFAQNEAEINAFATYYSYAVQRGQFEGTFRQYLTSMISPIIEGNQPNVVFTDPLLPGTKTIYNPWVATTATTNITVTREVLVKFWEELSINGFTFKVNSLTGIAANEDLFEDIIGSGNEKINVLGLTSETIGGGDYVKMGALYLLNPSGEYVSTGSTIIAGGKYKTTSVAPTA